MPGIKTMCVAQPLVLSEVCDGRVRKTSILAAVKFIFAFLGGKMRSKKFFRNSLVL